MIRFSIAPHAIEDDSQFASHGDEGSFFGAFGAIPGQAQSPAGQCRVWAEAAEYVMRRLHQETAQVDVAGFRNTQLRVGVTGLALAGPETQERACGAWGVDGVGSIKRQHVRSSDDGADARSRAQ